MNNNERLFAEGNISRTIFKLAIPLIVSQVINVLYNIVDRIYIGNIADIGTDALAGVGVAFPIITIVSAFAALFGMGGAPLAIIKLGEGKKDEAGKTLNNSFVMLTMLGFILTFILLIFSEDILYLFGAKESIIKYSKDYLNIYAIGTLPVMLTLGLNVYISAQGYSKTAMVAVLIGALTNIILDPIFIYLLNMGVAGAAIATVISQIASTIFILRFLISSKPIVGLYLKNFKIDFKLIISIIALGISPFIMQSTESLVQITFNLKIKEFGGDSYIIYLNLITIMLSIMQLIMLPLMGLASGATPMISYNYGANKFDRVKASFKVLFISSLTYSFVFYILIFIFPNIFVKIFNNDPELLKIAPKLFRIFFIGMSMMGIQIACQNTFMALGQSLISLILAALRKIILLIPLTIILPKYININGVFYSEPIADIIAVSITFIVFVLSFNKIIRKKQTLMN